MKKRRGKGHKPSEHSKQVQMGIVAAGARANRERWDDWNIRMRSAIILAKGGRAGITTDPIRRD